MDITRSMARIVVNQKDLPFTSVRTTAWDIGPVYDLIVTTRQRVNELHQLLWSKVPVMLTMYFIQGADLTKFATIIEINEKIRGEYTYHFSWG
ncbi:hypothetical protein IGH98_09145 [Bacillus thuringiensis]|nr:hypothetical protein [Bacillus thuringiensis]